MCGVYRIIGSCEDTSKCGADSVRICLFAQGKVDLFLDAVQRSMNMGLMLMSETLFLSYILSTETH